MVGKSDLVKGFAVGSIFGSLYLGADCLVHAAARKWTHGYMDGKPDTEKKVFLFGTVAAMAACLALAIKIKNDNVCYLEGDVFSE